MRINIENYYLLSLLGLLLLQKFIFLFMAVPLPDEAYYWLWAKNIDLSYFDHPPMMTWISCLFHYFEAEKAYFFRIPHIIFGTLTSLFLYKIGSLIYSKQTGVFSAILYFISPFFFFSGGFFVVPDGILNFSVAGATYFAIKIIFGNQNQVNK